MSAPAFRQGAGKGLHMTVKELAEKNIFELIHMGDNPEVKISKPFCCDLLSVAMGKAPAQG